MFRRSDTDTVTIGKFAIDAASNAVATKPLRLIIGVQCGAAYNNTYCSHSEGIVSMSMMDCHES